MIRGRKLLSVPLLFLLLSANTPPEELPSDGDSQAMRGFPPRPDQIVTRINHIKAPNLRWSLSHMRMLLPTTNIHRGVGPVFSLPHGKAFTPPSFVDEDGTQISFEQWMRRTHSDALLVLHQGKIVFEGYAEGVEASAPHTIQSVSKSFVGIITLMLAHEGKLDLNAPVAQYVPELASSAWGTATIQQSLDMTVGVKYNEDIKDLNSDVRRYYGVASGIFPPSPEYEGPRNIYDMLKRLPKQGEHGQGFIYKSVNPEAVAWAVSRVTGKRPSEVISERIWTKLGVEEDAYVTVDPAGTEMMGGGMSVTARDLARFGEMVRQDGRYNGLQIVPAAVIAQIFKGGDVEKFQVDPQRRSRKGYSYHDFWWKPPAIGVIEALGGFGQHIHVNKQAGTVIIKLSSAEIGLAYDEAKRLDALAFGAIDNALADVTMKSRENTPEQRR